MVFVIIAWAVVLAFIWIVPWAEAGLKEQAADRVLSTIHAVVSSAFGICALVFTQPICSTGDSWVRMPMLVFLGYLYVDLSSMLVCDVWKKWRKLDLGMIFHHVFIIVFLSAGYVYETGIWFGTILLCNEISTPCVNFHWYLIHTDRKDTHTFFVNGLALVVLFTICRMIFIPYSVYELASLDFCIYSENSSYKWAAYIIGLGYCILYAMNCVWYVSLVRGAAKKLYQLGNKASDSDIELTPLSSSSD